MGPDCTIELISEESMWQMKFIYPITWDFACCLLFTFKLLESVCTQSAMGTLLAGWLIMFALKWQPGSNYIYTVCLCWSGYRTIESCNITVDLLQNTNPIAHPLKTSYGVSFVSSKSYLGHWCALCNTVGPLCYNRLCYKVDCSMLYLTVWKWDCDLVI